MKHRNIQIKISMDRNRGFRCIPSSNQRKPFDVLCVHINRLWLIHNIFRWNENDHLIYLHTIQYTIQHTISFDYLARSQLYGMYMVLVLELYITQNAQWGPKSTLQFMNEKRLENDSCFVWVSFCFFVCDSYIQLMLLQLMLYNCRQNVWFATFFSFEMLFFKLSSHIFPMNPIWMKIWGVDATHSVWHTTLTTKYSNLRSRARTQGIVEPTPHLANSDFRGHFKWGIFRLGTIARTQISRPISMRDFSPRN